MMPSRITAGPTYAAEPAPRDFEFRRGRNQVSKFAPIADGKTYYLLPQDWGYMGREDFERAFRGFAKRRDASAHVVPSGRRADELAVQIERKQSKPF